MDQSRNYELKLPANGSQRTLHMTGNPFHYSFSWSNVKVRVPMTAGSHTVRWNAPGFDSGVYLVTVEYKGRIDSRKITLVK